MLGVEGEDARMDARCVDCFCRGRHVLINRFHLCRSIVVLPPTHIPCTTDPISNPRLLIPLPAAILASPRAG